MSDHVRLEPAPRIRVQLAGEVICDTTRGYVVYEAGLPPRYYVPRADVKAQLSDGSGAGTCPWKGQWKHLDVVSGTKRVPSGAWTYYETKPVTAPVRDFVAFYDTKLTVGVDGAAEADLRGRMADDET